jgi:hypothetical protein
VSLTGSWNWARWKVETNLVNCMADMVQDGYVCFLPARKSAREQDLNITRINKELLMKLKLRALAVAACLSVASNVGAQQLSGTCPPAGGSWPAGAARDPARIEISASQPLNGHVVTRALASTSVTAIGRQSIRGGLWPYSYYVLTPYPARGYVEYGPVDQFPFYGRAYGKPADRWSWYYMGGGGSSYLAKYYYPILP